MCSIFFELYFLVINNKEQGLKLLSQLKAMLVIYDRKTKLFLKFPVLF